MSSSTLDFAETEALFHTVADLPADDAARVLDARCAGAPALRATVERLLCQDRALPRDFLEPRAALAAEIVDAAKAIGRRAPEQPTLPAAERVGHFVIIEPIGQGATGCVYLAHDEALERRVALKVMRSGPLWSTDLVREARALARLTHPNVVQVYEVGTHQERPFIAMEWVFGRSLRGWLDERPRSTAELLTVFLQAGRGLAAAHDAGLVHCDFKPDNVLVGDDGRVRVADFGVAALLTANTRRTAAMGTPAFMAPEQFAGEPVTAASDQFAFCVALYSALFGVAPFAGSDVLELRRGVLNHALRSQPTSRAVSARLARVTERGLARNPANRFPTMNALLAALEQHVPPAAERDSAMGSRERMLVCAVLSMLGTAALVLLHVPRGSTRPPETMRLLLLPAAALVVHAVAALALRRQLLGNPFARRVAAMAWLGGITVVLHRLLAFRFGQPVPEVLAVDLLVLGLQQTIAAILLEAWFAIAALFFFVGAAVAVLAPGQAIGAMLGSVIAAYAVAAARAAWECLPARDVR